MPLLFLGLGCGDLLLADGLGDGVLGGDLGVLGLLLLEVDLGTSVTLSSESLLETECVAKRRQKEERKVRDKDGTKQSSEDSNGESIEFIRINNEIYNVSTTSI